MEKSARWLMVGAMLLMAGVSHAQVIYKNKGYQWKPAEIVQGKFKGKALSPTRVVSNYVPIPPKMEVWNDMNPKEINRREWNLSVDINHLPHYESSNVLDNALYNMSLEESVLAIEPDSTFRTGIAWGGVWTRDVSYSIIHSLAWLHPEVSMKSLRAKVTPNNRIVQDTGTGGAWPCSTDRTIWAVAAWEVYKVTGDRDWLTYIYPIILNTVSDDAVVAYNPATHLLRGETSYMDWREQEYPAWMEPADIFASEATVNNAVHYMAIDVLSQICSELGLRHEAKEWANYAATVRHGINEHLWLEDKGYYAIYRYGRRHPVLSEQCDAMGSALTILSGIADADRARIISEHQVSEPFGTPCIYPNLKDQYPYHNDATWPFVQGYWMRACAKVGNEQALLHSIGALYRGAALWLSNEENYEISTGDYQLTKLNSPRQLWSVAAQAAVVPHIYFGMNFEADRLTFTPFVPKTLAARRSLKNFRYRQSTLDITLEGYGREIASFAIDGQEAKPEVLATVQGKHTIAIRLADKQPAAMTMCLKDNAYLPITPVVKREGNTLTWQATEGSATYQVLQGGKVIATVSDTRCDLQGEGEYAVRGVSADGIIGYISEPLDCYTHELKYMARDFAKAEPSG
ncbi:MAG: hypothetical protein HUK03_05400, partial [Bacteroidaceae bacterium]|nr:hypothetical protein [Bacteroidaceae bacterium]